MGNRSVFLSLNIADSCTKLSPSMTVFIFMAWLGVAGVLLIKPSCIIYFKSPEYHAWNFYLTNLILNCPFRM